MLNSKAKTSSSLHPHIFNMIKVFLKACTSADFVLSPVNSFASHFCDMLYEFQNLDKARYLKDGHSSDAL